MISKSIRHLALGLVVLWTLSAHATNPAPYAHPLSVAVLTNTPTPIVLTGDDDASYIGSATNYHYSPNHHDIPALSFALLSNPTNGILSGTPPNLVYTPTAISGRDSFSFKVNDGELDSPPAIVQILITNRVSAVRWNPNSQVAVPRSDDAFQLWPHTTGSPMADRLNRSVNFRLGGSLFTSLYVNNNGNISFSTGVSSYSPGAFPLNLGTPIIAPLMCDVDTRDSRLGVVSISRDFVNGRQATTVTWPAVGYYFLMIDKSNTFQVVLIDRSDLSPGDMEVEFNYQDINWFTTAASPGLYPSAGWDFYDGVNYTNLPYSRTAFITNLITTSTGSSVPGRHVFRFTTAQHPTVTNRVATNIDYTSATLTADFSVRLAGASVGFYYGTNPTNLNFMVEGSRVPYGTNGTFRSTAQITGLLPGTTYYFKAETAGEFKTAQDPIGTGVFTTWGYPTILDMSPANGPSSGGTLVTLDGVGFGTNGTVTLGGVLCVVSNHTSTRIQFMTPAGMGTGQPVVVTANGFSSAPVAFNYDAPSITNVTSASTSGGSVATLTGSSFGTSGVVYFNGQPCTIDSYTHNQIRFYPPPGQGMGHQITVSAGGQTSNTRSFSYLPPTISSVSPSTGPTSGGTTVTIQGNNFGTNCIVNLGGTICTVTSQTHTSVSIVLPAGQGKDRGLLVSVSGQTDFLDLAFSYAAPEIYSATPDHGPTSGGTSVVLSGANFGTTPSVTLGGSTCSIVSASHSQITILTPPGQGINQPIQVNAANQLSNLRSFNYNPPSVASISPTNGPTSGGIVVTVQGSNFGTNSTVLFNGNACVTTSQTHSQIQFMLPPGQGTNNVVQVTASGQPSGSSLFNYNAPVISGIYPTNTPTTGGLVTLTGASFGTNGVVYFNGTPCATTNYTHSSLQFIAPPGEGTGHTISMEVGGQISNTRFFNYQAPVITSVTPQNGPTAGGIVISIAGQNFGLAPVVTIGGSVAPVSSVSHSNIEVTLPSGQGLNLPVVVTTAGQSSAAASFHYNAPMILSISPGQGWESGGTTVTLFGSNFGTNGTVTIAGETCSISSYSHTSVEFLTPPGSGKGKQVKINVSGQDSNPVLFDYYSDPEILTQPRSQTAFIKGAASFSVVALGSGTLHYQWQKVDGFTATNIAKANQPYLTFSSVRTNHAGVYRVMVSSDNGAVFSDEVTLTVQAVSEGVQAVAGRYNGLFYETNQVSHHSAGYFQAKLTTNAVCTGKLLLDGDTVSFSGKVNPEGIMVKEIARTRFGKAPLALTLAFDLTGGTDTVTGLVENLPLWSSSLAGDRYLFSKTNPAKDFSADYSLIFSTGTRVQGLSRALVRTNGSAGLTMSFRDGSKTKQGTFVSKQGQLPMYAPLYPGFDVLPNGKTNRNFKGSVLGWVHLTTNEPFGTAVWIRTGSGGFTNEISVDGWR